jgi:protein TonB
VSYRPNSWVLVLIYGGSVALHVGIGVGTEWIPKTKKYESVAIELADIKKKTEPPKPPPEPPAPKAHEENKPKPHVEAPAPEPEAKAKLEAAPAPESAGSPGAGDGFADLGIALGNSGGPGIAVPGVTAAMPTPGAAAGPKPPATHKVERLQATQAQTCTEPDVKPRSKVQVTPKYTMQARQSEIEGAVRVELTIDETGKVLSARVLSGLGYGLDESAIAAAKAMAFEPAMHCGKPVVGTKIVSFRFNLT